jgi:hypothetical protein
MSTLRSSKVKMSSPLWPSDNIAEGTYNQLTNSTSCRAVTVIYARDTTQAGVARTASPIPAKTCLHRDGTLALSLSRHEGRVLRDVRVEVRSCSRYSHAEFEYGEASA